MNETEVFILADKALAKVVGQIKPDQWDETVPPELTRVPGSSLRQVINYHAYDDSWVPDVLAGKTAANVGDKYDGDLLRDDPVGNFNTIVDRAVVAVRDFHDLDNIVHVSYGDFPAREYIKHITSFRGFRVYDLSKFLGLGTQMPPELVQGMWDVITPEIEQWRRMGVFGPEVEVSKPADLQSRLLGLAGRNPSA